MQTLQRRQVIGFTLAAGLWLGMRVFDWISEARFQRLVLGLVLISGAALLNALDAAVTSTARDLTTGTIAEKDARASVEAFLLANGGTAFAEAGRMIGKTRTTIWRWANDGPWVLRGYCEGRAAGKTFRWAGRYSENLASRETLDTQLNVFADFNPILPDAWQQGIHSDPGVARWNGQTIGDFPFSVAQHSVLVSEIFVRGASLTMKI